MTKSNQVHIFWIFGNLRQSKAKWNALCDYIEQHAGVAPNVESVYCGSGTDSSNVSSMKDVVCILRTKDMFSNSPRILRVIGIPEDYQDMLSYVDVPRPQNLLVFWGPPGYYKSGPSKKWNTIKNTKLFKFIKKHGHVFEFPVEAATDNDAVNWVTEIAQEKKKTISRDTAKLLVNRQGRNLDMLDNSVEKLATYQKSREISSQDVKDCCGETFSSTVWEYINSIDRNDCDAALAYLQGLYNEKPEVGSTFYGTLSQLLGALRQHFLFLMLAKDASGNSVNVKLIEESAKEFKKFTPTQLTQICNGEDVTLSDRFSGNYIRNKVNNPGFSKLLGRRKSKIYGLLQELQSCSFAARQNSSNEAYLRMSLDLFTLVACGKITADQAAMARGTVG